MHCNFSTFPSWSKSLKKFSVSVTYESFDFQSFNFQSSLKLKKKPSSETHGWFHLLLITRGQTHRNIGDKWLVCLNHLIGSRRRYIDDNQLILITVMCGGKINIEMCVFKTKEFRILYRTLFSQYSSTNWYILCRYFAYGW